MKKNIEYGAKIVALGALLSVLPGCALIETVKGWFGGAKSSTSTPKDMTQAAASAQPEKDHGEWMIRIAGEPVFYKDDFNDSLDALVSSPQFRGAITAESLPTQMKLKVLQNLAKMKVFEKKAEEMGVHLSAEFLEQYEKTTTMIRQQMLVQFLQKQIFEEQVASEDEIKEEFAQNRERYVRQPGGVALTAVKFDSEDAARSFLEAMGEEVDTFDQEAQKVENGEYRDFGRVTVQSPTLPDAFKQEMVEGDSFPLLKMVKDGDDFWVAFGKDKTEPEYMALDEVKQHLETMLKHGKFQQELENLEKEVWSAYNVEVNEEILTQEEEAKKALAQADLDKKEALKKIVAQAQAQASEKKDASAVKVAAQDQPSAATAA